MLREGIARHAGYEINTEGDAFHIAFKGVTEAVAFAMDVQYRLAVNIDFHLSTSIVPKTPDLVHKMCVASALA